MVWSAGQKVTANRLAVRSNGVDLANTNCATSYQQWGTETVTFPNPGMACTIKMWLSGRFVDSTPSDSSANVHIDYSVDGGATFTSTVTTAVNFGSSSGSRADVTAMGFYSGTPTGSIAIKAMQLSNAGSSTLAASGQLMAELVPNP